MDLWRRTLTQIPTVFGKLVYLASLRDSNHGGYEHHGLALIHGELEASRTLLESHERTFSEWLQFDLERQKADLDLYLSSLMIDRRTVIGTWLRLRPYANLAPVSAKPVEKQLYLADLEALLGLVMNELGVSDPNRDA